MTDGLMDDIQHNRQANRIDALETQCANEKARADAAEKHIEELTNKFAREMQTLSQAWALRDEAIKERQEAEAALRSALRLAAFLIKDILRGMPE